MPAVINVCANVLFGGGLALATQRSEALRRELVAWPFLFLLGFEALFITPLATYLFRFYPQWSLLYSFDPQIFTNFDQWVGWLSAAAIALNFVAALCGYTLARWGVVHDRAWLKAAPPVVVGLFMVVVFWHWGDRVAFIGDYDTFWQGQADLLFTRTAGWVGLGLYLGTFLFVLWVHARYREREPSLF